MAKLNNDDIMKFVGELGYAVSDVVLGLLVQKVDALDICLSQHYDEATQQLIKLYAVALLVGSQGGRKLSSQHAPSGASRSFEYGESGLKQLRELLSNLDVHGCTDSLPISVSPVGFFDVVG